MKFMSELMSLDPVFWNSLLDALVVSCLWGTPPLVVLLAIDSIWGRANPLFFKRSWRAFHVVALSGFVFVLLSTFFSDSKAAWDCFGFLPEAPPETRSRAAFSFFWLVTVLVLAAYQGFRYFQARREVKALPQMKNRAVNAMLDDLSPDFSTPASFEVRVGRRTKSPFVFGLFPPTLVLHRRLLRASSREVLRPALAHELTHLRQRDGFWNLLANAFSVVFFFHPLVWIGARIYHRTVERCADQMALRGGVKPRDLMRATLALMDAGTPGAAMALSREFHSLKDRFEAMTAYDRGNFFPLWKQVVFVMLLAVSALTPAMYNPARVIQTVTPGFEVGSCFRSEPHLVSQRNAGLTDSKVVRN
jgi:beta-lactamase regulating signal transducer with metallopeptidase domain